MPLDQTYINRNRLSTQRIRALAARLSDEEMQTRGGEHLDEVDATLKS